MNRYSNLDRQRGHILGVPSEGVPEAQKGLGGIWDVRDRPINTNLNMNNLGAGLSAPLTKGLFSSPDISYSPTAEGVSFEDFDNQQSLGSQALGRLKQVYGDSVKDWAKNLWKTGDAKTRAAMLTAAGVDALWKKRLDVSHTFDSGLGLNVGYDKDAGTSVGLDYNWEF